MPDTSAAPPASTLDDLLRCGADELLNHNPPATAYHELWSRLFAAAQAAAEDAPKAAALTFLAKISSMMLEPDDRAASFKPMMSSPTGRTTLPEDFTAAEVGLMADLAPTVQHPLLRARLADLVWLKERRRGIAFAHMAIEGYRQPPISDPEWDFEALKCRQRAIQLAHTTGKGGGIQAAEDAGELLGAFWNALETGDQIAALRYLRPLQSEGLLRDQSSQIAEALEREGRRQLDGSDPFSSLLFAEGAVVWFSRAQDDERRAAAQILVAESWVAQADKDGSGITTHHCYTKAIDAYRRVSAQYRGKFGAADAIAQLRAKLPAAGQDMLARMKTVSHSFDISDLVAEAVGKVQGLAPDKALFAFCRIAPWPSLEALRREAEIPLSGIAALFSNTSVDENGRVIAVVDGVDDADSRERRLVAEMIKASVRRADIAARALIDPALDVIRQQCHLSPRDFYAIAQLSTLVPGDRTDLVAKGLYAGYCCDFVQAIHILMPQFEHMVRVVLKEAGAQTTSRQDDIEMELGLSALVELPQMKERFGEHLTFTVRALMCKPLGPNLRNKVAHGLAGSNLCNSGYGIYAWWLILALVVEGFRMMQQAEEENNPDSAKDA
ncbi:hypothetical protein CDO46_09165 [Pigmentiphaga sp. NML030171]|uniref:DUF4209 domain-containing protein n=1 Tax=Pigmentiphaga sp. NML030171 TaxID=2008676 RepID=UPI000B42317B|nr:DUF4209 domain-containing protein [Pigmentiphaga sp. NML030171]OVZ64369.1 hypothetical protein CDO46_09165 [Pigmentiphaga sp. NML030171]